MFCVNQVTIDLPSEGVPLDRVTLPDNVNIKAVKVYYSPEGRNSLLPINGDKVIFSKIPLLIYFLVFVLVVVKE
jgi:hypothetical protein